RDQGHGRRGGAVGTGASDGEPHRGLLVALEAVGVGLVQGRERVFVHGSARNDNSFLREPSPSRFLCYTRAARRVTGGFRVNLSTPRTISPPSHETMWFPV